MVVRYSGIAGRRGHNPRGVVLHNDAGSQAANAAFYRNWLPSHSPEVGYAHDYVASDGTYHAEDYMNCAWHCGNSYGNREYIGIEICQSMGNAATVKANELKAFKLAAKICKKYGIKIVKSSFPLHKMLSSTSCPHRSVAFHGPSNSAVQNYFVQQIKKASGSKTSTPSKSSNSKPVKNGKVGDKVKVVIAIYKESYGKGKSTAKKGKTGVIKKIGPGSKKYLIENWGWAHPNDIVMVQAKKASAKAKNFSKDYYTSNPKKVKLLKADGLYGKNDVDFKKGKVGGSYPKGTYFNISAIKKRKDG